MIQKTNSDQETMLFGEKLIKSFQNYKLFIIKGEVGAGKTVLVTGMAHALGIDEKITSPTFAIKNQYANLVHYDLYFSAKLKSKEFNALLAEDLKDNIVVIEWGEKIIKRFLEKYVLVTITIDGDNQRTIQVKEKV